MGTCILCAWQRRIRIHQAQVAGVPVRRDMGVLLHRRRHYITPGGVWLRRPGGVCEDAGAGSAKRTAEGAADDGGVGKITRKGNLTAGPAEENADAKDNFPGNLRIGRPLLVHRWKPNQAEACNKEEHHGRGDAMHRGDCDGGMHVRSDD